MVELLDDPYEANRWTAVRILAEAERLEAEIATRQAEMESLEGRAAEAEQKRQEAEAQREREAAEAERRRQEEEAERERQLASALEAIRLDALLAESPPGAWPQEKAAPARSLLLFP